MNKNRMKFTMILMAALLFGGCAAKPTHLELTIKSTGDLNPDSENISSPLMLNFYELESAEKFSKLDFWTLLDKGNDRLSTDLVSQSKHIIVPSEEQEYKILFDKKAKFLGIIGNFRKIDENATWRYVINLKEKDFNKADLLIDRYAIRKEK